MMRFLSHRCRLQFLRKCATQKRRGRFHDFCRVICGSCWRSAQLQDPADGRPFELIRRRELTGVNRVRAGRSALREWGMVTGLRDIRMHGFAKRSSRLGREPKTAGYSWPGAEVPVQIKSLSGARDRVPVSVEALGMSSLEYFQAQCLRSPA